MSTHNSQQINQISQDSGTHLKSNEWPRSDARALVGIQSHFRGGHPGGG